MPSSIAEADVPRSPRKHKGKSKAKVRRREHSGSNCSSSESSDSSEEEGLRDAVKAHAYQFYLRHGGKIDQIIFTRGLS
jgi:hypothetical protein